MRVSVLSVKLWWCHLSGTYENDPVVYTRTDTRGFPSEDMPEIRRLSDDPASTDDWLHLFIPGKNQVESVPAHLLHTSKDAPPIRVYPRRGYVWLNDLGSRMLLAWYKLQAAQDSELLPEWGELSRHMNGDCLTCKMPAVWNVRYGCSSAAPGKIIEAITSEANLCHRFYAVLGDVFLLGRSETVFRASLLGLTGAGLPPGARNADIDLGR